MRVSQSFLVLCLVAVVAAVGIAVFAFRSANLHQDIMLAALQRGLERVYDEAVSGTPHPEPPQPFSLTAESLRKVLLNVKKQRAILPSFVNFQDVFLPRESVLIPSDQLVCIVRVGNARLYGISGKRVWREVSPEEFGGWTHESLSTNGPATQ